MTEGLLPARRPRPAAERPEPADRHVPGPGRRAACPPHPGPPGADQPSRIRPANASASSRAGRTARTSSLTARPGTPPASSPAALGQGPSPTGCPLRHPAAGLQPAAGGSASRPRSRRPAPRWPSTGRDLEACARPLPHGTGNCADPEAAWGHRNVNLQRNEGRDVLRLLPVRRGHGGRASTARPSPSSPAGSPLSLLPAPTPPRAFAPVLTAMPASGSPLGDILADSGYSHRDPGALGIPAARRRRQPRPGPAPARPRPPRHPRTARSSPTGTSTARPAPRATARPRAAVARRHRRRRPRTRREDRRAGPLQARPPHRRRRRRLPPGPLPRRRGQDPLPASPSSR